MDSVEDNVSTFHESPSHPLAKCVFFPSLEFYTTEEINKTVKQIGGQNASVISNKVGIIDHSVYLQAGGLAHTQSLD
jgi:hypothetical protein